MTLDATTRLNSIRQAAKQLGVSPSTLRRDIRLRRIRAVRYGRRVLIPVAELDRIEREGLPITAAQPEEEVSA
jgi:excisionase family DNA binding protein